MLNQLPLHKLAILYFETLLKDYERDYRFIDPPPEVKKRKLLDFIIFIDNTGERWGVLIKDWNKSIGSDLMMRFKRVIDALELTAGIIVGKKISELALGKAKKYGIIALTRGEIISYLYKHGYGDASDETSDEQKKRDARKRDN